MIHQIRESEHFPENYVSHGSVLPSGRKMTEVYSNVGTLSKRKVYGRTPNVAIKAINAEIYKLEKSQKNMSKYKKK